MILADKINMYANNPGVREGDSRLLPNYEEIAKQNKKVIAMFLSIIPGVGHLYLGMQRQGIELMASFFLLFYLTDWVRFSGFMILAPIIWFYSLFDVMHKVSGER
jgi:TM2 domain-containing membrane protein YozV